MSLEQAIEANTAAIAALTEVWGKLVQQGTTAQKNSEATGSAVSAGGKIVKPAAGAATTGASTASSKLEKEPVEAKANNREAMSKAIISLAAKIGRDAALAVLAPFGASSGKAVKDEDVDAVLEAVNAAAAEADLG